MPETRTSEPEIINPDIHQPEIPAPPTRSPEIQQPYPNKPEISTPPDPEAPAPTPQPELPRQPGTPEIQPGNDPGPIEGGNTTANTTVEGGGRGTVSDVDADVNRSPASRNNDSSVEGGGSDIPGPIEGEPRGMFTV